MGNSRYYRIVAVGVMFFFSYILYFLFGRNKREQKSVPAGMQLLALTPLFRYMMYGGAMLFLVFGVTMAAGMASEGVEPVLFLLIAGMCAVASGLFFVLGYAFYSCHVFFDREKIMIGRPFRQPDILTWEEVGRTDFKRTRVLLYDKKGKRRLEASAGMIGYESFRELAEWNAQRIR